MEEKLPKFIVILEIEVHEDDVDKVNLFANELTKSLHDEKFKEVIKVGDIDVKIGMLVKSTDALYLANEPKRTM